MRISRRTVTAGSAFFLAFSTAHLMQSGPGYVAALRGQPEPVSAQALGRAVITPLKAEANAAPTTAGARALPDLPGDPVPALVMQGSLTPRLRDLDRQRVTAPSAEPVAVNSYGIACTGARLDLSASRDLMIDAALVAPCAPDQPVMIRHAGLELPVTTDRQGRARIRLPALSPDAEVNAVLEDGQVVSARMPLPALAGIRRVALVPATGDGAGLRVDGARTDGAEAGLSPGLRVATAPARSASTLTLVVPVTADNCGQAIAGRVILAGPAPAVSDYTIAMPDCAAVGDSVALRLDAPAPLRLAGQ